MKIVNIHEAKTTLSALVQYVLDGGKVIIAKNNRPLVELMPLKQVRKPRKPGMLKGKMQILENWDVADREIASLMNSSIITPDDEISD